MSEKPFWSWACSMLKLPKLSGGCRSGDNNCRACDHRMRHLWHHEPTMSCNGDQFPCNVTATRALIAALVISLTAIYAILRKRIQQDPPETSQFGVQVGDFHRARFNNSGSFRWANLRPSNLSRRSKWTIVAVLFTIAFWQLYCNCYIPQVVNEWVKNIMNTG